jgi:GNAT superfamily N-acetyltransferase
MPDMLVKLYNLPPLEPILAAQRAKGITVRRALAPEKHHVLDWVERHFSPFWASESDVAFSNDPVSIFIATQDGCLRGFACYDATCLDFFGPTGVNAEFRGQGIGEALLLACLHAMRQVGYGYAIIGGAGPTGFYEKVAGATAIPDSSPGIYEGMLRHSGDAPPASSDG